MKGSMRLNNGDDQGVEIYDDDDENDDNDEKEDCDAMVYDDADA